MYSPLKILVCVATLCATTVSTNEWKKTADVINLRTSIPYQWQTTNVRIPNYDILRVDNYNPNLYTRTDGGGRFGNSEYNVQQSPVQEVVNPTLLLGGKTERQFPNGRNGLLNKYSGLGEYSFYSLGQSGDRSSDTNNWQRQPQFSEGNTQTTETSGGSNKIPFLQNWSLTNNQQQSPQILSMYIDPSYREGLGAQRVGNQNDFGQGGFLGENIQLKPSEVSTLRPNQVSNDISSEFLESQRTGQISGGSQENNEGPENKIETQRNNLSVYSFQNSLPGGDIEASVQPQAGRNSIQLGLNQFRSIQKEPRGDNNGRPQFFHISNRQRQLQARDGPGINIASRQEALESVDPKARTNLGTNSKSAQTQQDGNQNNIAQQQPNIYSYEELSAKIWKVIQSNPSMLSNMNGLMEQLQDDNDSGNQQIRQLKSLLEDIGKYNGYSSSSGTSSGTQGQQNPLIKNLLEIMNRNKNNQNNLNVPVSYQSYISWRY